MTEQAQVETTRERIARALATMAAEEQPSIVGKTIQMVYGMGMGGAIVDALPEDDATADAQLEYLAGIVLALRSPAAMARNPFEPVFATAAPEAIDPADPVGLALGLDQAQAETVLATVGLESVALADLESLAQAMEDHSIEKWAGIGLVDVRVEIERQRQLPAPEPAEL